MGRIHRSQHVYFRVYFQIILRSSDGQCIAPSVNATRANDNTTVWDLFASRQPLALATNANNSTDLMINL